MTDYLAILLLILAAYLLLGVWVGSMLRRARELQEVKPLFPVARAVRDEKLDIDPAVHRTAAIHRRSR